MKKFSYILALLPMLLIFSLLLVAPVIFLLSFIPSNKFPISPIWIIECFIVVLLLVYGIILNKSSINSEVKLFYWSVKAKLLYWIASIFLIIVTIVSILCFKNLLIIFCQIFLPIIYILHFEYKFSRFKTYIQKSSGTLYIFNVFDAIFITIYLILKCIIQTYLENIENFLNKLNAPQDVVEPIVTVLLLITLFILIPFLRGYLAVKKYKKQNNISIPSENVFWNVNIKTYVISLVSICLYTSTLLEDGKYALSTVLITCLIFMSFTVFFWAYIFEDIDRGGENKEIVKSNWLVFGLILIFLVLLSLIESELIGILTWFLPVLIPNIIGDINKYSNPEKKQTSKMQKHLYYLTLVSFNLLFSYNILSILSSKYKIKDTLIDIFLKIFNIKLTIISNLLTTIFLLSISIIIALLASKLIIKYLEKHYLTSSNNYFE